MPVAILSHNSLWLPDGYFIICWVVRQAHLAAAVGIHEIDFSVTVALRTESYLRSIWRPAWVPIIRTIVGQVGLAAPICIHDVDLIITVTIRAEGDFRPIWRPGRKSITYSYIRQADYTAADLLLDARTYFFGGVSPCISYWPNHSLSW